MVTVVAAAAAAAVTSTTPTSEKDQDETALSVSSISSRQATQRQSSSPVTTAKSARNFWQEKINQTGENNGKKTAFRSAHNTSNHNATTSHREEDSHPKSEPHTLTVSSSSSSSHLKAKPTRNYNNDKRSLKYHRKDDTRVPSVDPPSPFGGSNVNQSLALRPVKEETSPLPIVESSAPLANPTLDNHDKDEVNNDNDYDDNDNDNGVVGEMQIKLDIAEAKIITEEMKYKDMQEQMETMRETYSRRIIELEEQLTMEQKKCQRIQTQQQEQCKSQKEEMDELCLEIERLHESHRAERNVVDNERCRWKEEMKGQSLELQRVKMQLQQQQQEKQQKVQQSMTVQSKDIHWNSKTNHDDEFDKKNMELQRVMEELNQVKTELDVITAEYKDLHDETERLEIELETVTEDRDELLRRSIVYHKQAQSMAQSQTSPEQTAKKSLSESSRQDYETEQHQAEIGRLTNTLNELQQVIERKDWRIQELEDLVDQGKSKGSFDLDLSAIEVENTSLMVDDRESRKRLLEEQSNAMQRECSRLTTELEDARKKLANVQIERDGLKKCLADAMQEIELHELNEDEKDQANEKIVKDLMQVIKEKEVEIETLNDQLTHETRLNNFSKNSSADSLQEDFNNVIEWLDSSTRINGSPSIEMMIVSNTSQDFKLAPEDENLVREIYAHIKELKVKQLLSQEDKYEQPENSLSGESSNQEQDYETSTEASFEREGMDSHTAQKMDVISTRFAADAVMNLRQHLRSMRNEIQMHKKKSEELRMSLSEASDLIKPLNDHAVRIENERLELQEKLTLSNQKLDELEKVAAGDFDSKSGRFLRISSLDLRKKDDEIISLKILLNQLRDELRTARGEDEETKCSMNGQFDKMLTPTKSNKVKDKHTWQEHAQSTNEEDYQKSRSAASEVERLKHDLAKSKNAEQTLKALLHDSASHLAVLSTQAENLANEKNEAENLIERLEKEKLEIEEEFSRIKHRKFDFDSKAQTETLSVKVSRLTVELKASNKERKKLKKSLTEAVGMLNALRKHVETSEKERKKLKRHLRNFVKNNQNIEVTKALNHDGFTNRNPSSSPDIEHVPDPDKIENETTILNLRSHIVEMEHEIRTLEDRINELEMANPRGEAFTIDTGVVQESTEIKKLKEELAEAQNSHKVANDMLNEIAEINKDMLNDLKETEFEAAEAVNELNTLRKEYAHLMAEIDEAKYVTKGIIEKLYRYDNEESSDYTEIDRLPLVDCINHLQRQLNRWGG